MAVGHDFPLDSGGSVCQSGIGGSKVNRSVHNPLTLRFCNSRSAGVTLPDGLSGCDAHLTDSVEGLQRVGA